MKPYLGLLLCACGGVTAAFDDELYRRLSREDKTAIYERENDVTIALSRRDEARSQVAETELSLAGLGDSWSRFRERAEKASQAGRVDGAKKIRETREAFLRDRLRIAEAHVAYRELEIVAARARLELQKQRQLVKSGVERERTLERFEREVRDTEQAAQAGERKEIDLRADSQKRFLEWKAAESEYARASGDFDSLVWTD